MSYYISLNNGEKVVQIKSFDQTVKKELNLDTNKEQIVYQLTARISDLENYNNLIGTFDIYYRTDGVSSLTITNDNDDVYYQTSMYTELCSENLFLDDEAEDLVYTLYFEMKEDIEEEEES